MVDINGTLKRLVTDTYGVESISVTDEDGVTIASASCGAGEFFVRFAPNDLIFIFCSFQHNSFQMPMRIPIQDWL